MDMKFLMKQAQKIQQDITKAQNELAKKEYEATAGGGAIVIKAKGSMHIEEVHIDPDMMKEDVADVEAMLAMTINSLIEKIEKDREEIMKPITGGAKFPGVF